MVATAVEGAQRLCCVLGLSPEEAAVYLVQGHGDRKVAEGASDAMAIWMPEHGNTVGGVGIT